jgi:hypothetical protein
MAEMVKLQAGKMCRCRRLVLSEVFRWASTYALTNKRFMPILSVGAPAGGECRSHSARTWEGGT